MNKPKAIDLFCGAGGLSLGLERAGFNIVLAADFDRIALETYSRNLSHEVLQLDLSSANPKAVMQRLGISGEIDLIAGGPPCQGFSLQRRGLSSDSRNDLVHRYLDWVAAVRPKFFLMENVAGLLGSRGLPHLRRVLDRAAEMGYACQHKLVNAADYGVPQLRKRLLVIGQRSDFACVPFEFPQASHDDDAYETVRSAIADLPPPPADGSEHPQWPNHRADRLSPINRERFRHVPEGGGRADIPARLRLKCHNVAPDQSGHRYVYGRLAWDRPASTITARFDSLTRGRFGHPSQTRTISLREGARLQSFPDRFIFFGTKVEVARQIGNAVPPLLAEVVGRAVARTIAAATKRHQKRSRAVSGA